MAALTTEAAALKITNALAPHTNDFISTIDFKRLFVGFVHVEMLLVLREVCKGWNDVVVERVDEIFESGEMIVQDGKDIRYGGVLAREERRELVTRVIFLLNITKVRINACAWADNLVVVDIPEGVEIIGDGAFRTCRSLTAVSFPTTLKSIGESAFNSCSSLENVDLLHTNLQEIETGAFHGCPELKSMTIPVSHQTLGGDAFWGCSKLVPRYINTYNKDAVIAHLRSLQN
ncbi:hypothetical protein TrLO_g2771 [Triparma laevis f. longispina]|uniref:Leucine-rich repeat domain-containing protein n=1 Tax=Triparma laevis f. longispina TaxID=1714387 RepID=A0A9W7L0U3_9STRA|nr:hypothetical protein TrLO_g2771 [Triparma laevis f. longispina]